MENLYKKEKKMNWYIRVIKKYVDFSGRARRKEYWYFYLFNVIISYGIYLIGSFAADSVGLFFFWILILYDLFIFLPSWAVYVRRLHDTGHSGWFLFIGLIPIVGPIMLLITLLSDSHSGQNEWGRSPKYGTPVVEEIGK